MRGCISQLVFIQIHYIHLKWSWVFYFNIVSTWWGWDCRKLSFCVKSMNQSIIQVFYPYIWDFHYCPRRFHPGDTDPIRIMGPGCSMSFSVHRAITFKRVSQNTCVLGFLAIRTRWYAPTRSSSQLWSISKNLSHIETELYLSTQCNLSYLW